MLKRKWIPQMLLATSLVLPAAACRDSTGVESAILRVQRSGASLELYNRSNRTVYTFAADRNSLPLIDWAPCPDPMTGGGIEAGETRVTPLVDILGPDPAPREIVVYYWHLVPKPSPSTGFQPDEIRSLVIEIG
jgi:hypothetical protein